MLTLGIRYLTRYVAATNLSNSRVEWPPHPGRVFMALAAAHFESGGDPAERVALEWLERAGPPALKASDIDERSPVRAYVPVNDTHGGIGKRPRQDRSFPRGRLHDEFVYLVWNVAPDASTVDALNGLCRKVTRVGHSTSAVQMWAQTDATVPEANWLPEDTAQDARLRIAGGGTLQRLELEFNGVAMEAYDQLAVEIEGAKGKQRAQLKKDLQERFPWGRPESRRPVLTTWQGYRRPSPAGESLPITDGPFDDNFLVLARQEGPNLGLESTLRLTGALRKAFLKALDPDVPEWISGHDAAGNPTQHPHVAFFPLPYVDAAHADGHVLGLGVALPRELAGLDRAAAAEATRAAMGRLLFDPETDYDRDIKLYEGREWEWVLSREVRERPPYNLRRLAWTRASREWASVTPVVLHHYPRRPDDVARIVRQAFVSAGFPEPEEVVTSGASYVTGAGHVRDIPWYTEGGSGMCRYQTHVRAAFATPVRGLMLVGRGRFRGYGLFRPMEGGLE